MDAADQSTSDHGSSLRAETLLHLLVVVAIGFVFSSVLAHPTEMIYSPVSDILPGHHPYRALQLQALARGDLVALWDPTAFGGMPLISDPQSGIFYPPNWLHVLDWSGQGEGWYGWYMVLHLLIGGAGMLWWLRGHGFSPAARFVGAMAFALCSKWFFHVVFKGHIVFLPLVWLPWQLGIIERIRIRPSLRLSGLLAIAVALMITGTHPQFLLYALVLVAAYGLFVLASPRSKALLPGLREPGEQESGDARIRAFFHLSVAAVLTLGLVAVFIAPVINGMDLFVRGAGFDYEEVVRRSLSFRQLMGFLIPMKLPGERLAKPFVGVLAFVLMLFAVQRSTHRRTALFALGAFAFFVWYGFGARGGLYRFLFDTVPGFDLFRFPNRAILMLGLPLGFASAAGFTALCEESPNRGKRVMATITAAAAATLLFYRTLYQAPGDVLIAAAALAVPMLCVLPWPAKARAALASVIAFLVFADQARFASSIVETRPLDEVLGRNPIAEALAGGIGQGRVLAFDRRRDADMSSLPVTYATRNQIEILRGFNPLIPLATARYLYTGAARGKMSSKHKTSIETFPILSRKHLDLFNVRWVVTNQPTNLEGLQLREHVEDLYLYHFQTSRAHTHMPHTYLYENMEVYPRAALVRGALHIGGVEEAIEAIEGIDPKQVVLLEDADEVSRYPGTWRALTMTHLGDAIEVDVDADQGGYLLLSEVWYPGWRAEDNGEPIASLRANGIFRAIHLSPGRHHIRMDYLPPAYGAARFVSAAAVIGTLVCLKLS